MAELSRVRTWADALIRLHLTPEWTFAFDNAKTRAGLCNFTAKRISVSRYIAQRSDDDDIHQVLLHEVAHAIAGPDAGHGDTWKRLGLGDTQQIADVVVDPRDADRAWVAAMGHAFGPNAERGVFRTEYAGTTLRDHLGLNQQSAPHRKAHSDNVTGVAS